MNKHLYLRIMICGDVRILIWFECALYIYIYIFIYIYIVAV